MNESIFTYAKRLVKHSSIYGLGAILNRAVAIVLLPLYTRYLTPGEYGDLELFFITSTFLFMILQFGMGSAIFRSIVFKSTSKPGVILNTAFFFLFFMNFMVVLLLCGFAETLSLAIFESPDNAPLLRILFVTDFFLVIAVVAESKLRIDERSALFSSIALGNFILGMILTIVFFVVFNWGISGILWAQLINAVIFTIIYLSAILKDFQFRFSFRELKEMLGFGLPLVPASIATSVLMLSSRYFLEHLGNADDVGIFSAGYRVAQIISLTVNAFQMAWPTLLFSIAKGENARNTFSKILNYLVFILVTLSLVLSVFARELLFIFTSPAFIDAQFIIPLLTISNILWGIFYVTCIGIQLEKKTIYVAIVTGVAAVVNLGLNFWLISIPDFSLMGAALASVIANLLVVVATLVISLHYYHIRYEYGKIFYFTVLAILIYTAGLFVPSGSFGVSIVLKTLLIALFLVVMYFSNYFSSNEIDKIKQFLKEGLSRFTSRTKRA
jgi:O-antigen/teichoic acid export membrane protein